MDNSNKEMLDVKALFHYLLHNWYWFLIALVIFGCAAGCFYASRPKVCTVAMTVQISPEEESVLLPGTGVLQTSNKAVNIGDEQAVFVSQDVLQKAINEAKLNVTFYKKYHLRWLEEWLGKNRPHCIETPQRQHYDRIHLHQEVFLYGRRSNDGH